MQPTQTLISRTQEKQRLQMALHSNKPELIALTGRRRVGKTFLIRKAYEKQIKLEIIGLQKDNQKAQLRNFLISMRAYGMPIDKVDQPDNWLDAFFLLTQQLEQQHFSEK